MIGITQTARELLKNQAVRAVLTLAISMVATVVVGTLILLYDLRQRELAHAQGETLSLNRILAEQTTRTIDGVALAMYGTRERLSDRFGRDLGLNSAPVHLLLRSRIVGLPQVKSMFIVDSRGMVINSSRSDLVAPFSVVQREFFQYLSANDDDGLFISKPERAQMDGQWTYYIGIRLANTDGSFRGVVASAIRIEYFESLYDSIHLDFVSRIQLLSRQGALMAGHRTADGDFGERVTVPVSLSTITTHPDQEIVLSVQDAQEAPWIAAYRQVAKYPLIVSAAVSEQEALTPWRRVAVPIATGAAVVVLFILLATTIVLKNMLRRERLQLERDASDEQLRHMVQSVRDAILTVDSSQKIILFNSSAEGLFGVSAKDALNQNVEQLLLHSQPKVLASSLLRYLREGWQSPGGLALLGIVSLVKDGQEIPVELSLSSTSLRGEHLVTAIFRDLSERQRTELELVKSNLRLQELSASLESIREQERLRISRELHDELGQALTGLRMEVSWLGSRLLAAQPEMENKVVSVKKLIDGTIASVRRISSELRPLVLDDLGFSAAASWYVDQFAERTGLKVNLLLPDRDPENGGEVATTLFRALQESLTNIARHADAHHVDVRLRYVGDWWRLEIRDDGRGFDSALSGKSGIGLLGMRERVQILGGTFDLTASPGQGTLVEIGIPAECPQKVG